MVAFDAGETLAERFRSHMGDATTLYGYAMRGMADDWEAGGVTRQICSGWESSPTGTMIQLRYLAGIFRIVLRGEAPELAAFYPCLHGSAPGPAPAERVWPVMREVAAAHVEELRQALHVVPQTNEPGRAAVLLIGLFEAVRRHGIRRIRLWEIGASAGLNLYADRFRYVGPGWEWGPDGSPLVLSTDAPMVRVEDVEIVQRRGCDLDPIDPTTGEGADRLRSFVWPWHVSRHDRLSAALAVAQAERAAGRAAVVDRAGAGEWLERHVAAVSVAGAGADVLTVVWQSITRMYWPPDEGKRVDAAIAAARARFPLAHVTMEHPDEVVDGRVVHAREAQLAVDGDPLGWVHPHGIPVWL